MVIMYNDRLIDAKGYHFLVSSEGGVDVNSCLFHMKKAQMGKMNYELRLCGSVSLVDMFVSFIRRPYQCTAFYMSKPH